MNNLLSELLSLFIAAGILVITFKLIAAITK